MAGLVDIAPQTDSVSVGAVKVPVYGVSAKGIAHLLGRFPELRMLMSGKAVTAEALMAIGGDVVAAIIAAGCGYPGDADQEAAAGRLGVSVQADFLEAIIGLTMPQGVGPFVERLQALMGNLGAAENPSASGPGTKSPKRSRN